MSWLEEVAKDEIQQQGRPVSSQLSRIESGLDTLLQCQAGFEQNSAKQVAAILEGQARLKGELSGRIDARWAESQRRLAAIEAKLETVVAHVSAPALTCTVSNYRTRKQLASKKPSHKARHAKRST